MNNSIKGEKRLCSNCGLKFFDLNKRPIICPRCKHEILDKEIAKAKTIERKKTDMEKSITENDIIVEDEDAENNEDYLEEDSDDESSTIVNIDLYNSGP